MLIRKLLPCLILVGTGFLSLSIETKTPPKFKYDSSEPLETQLRQAANNADLDFIKKFVEKNPGKINAKISVVGSLLHHSVLATQLNIPTERNASDRMVLDKGFLKRQLELVNYLIGKDADVNMEGVLGTPLHVLATHGMNNRPVFIVLLEKGGDPASRKHFAKTSVLELAARSGFSEMVELLLKKGVPLSKKYVYTSAGDTYSRSAILTACEYPLAPVYQNDHGELFSEYVGNKKVIALLLKALKDENVTEIRNNRRENALHIAIKKGFPERAEFLIKNCKNLDINAPCPSGTPLELAQKSSNLTRVQKIELKKFLIAHGAKGEPKNK